MTQTSGSFFTGYLNAVPMQDDQVVDQVLPFAFPNPGGVCTTAGFCSNGFVWMDNFNNGAPAAPYVPAFLSEGPRIAAMWTDLDLTAGGAVPKTSRSGITAPIYRRGIRVSPDSGFHDLRPMKLSRTPSFGEAAPFARLNAMAFVGLSAARQDRR